MIQSRLGRAVLRRYSHHAQMALECALRAGFDNNLFRLLVRTFWLLRAYEFYDARNRPAYMEYHYTMNNLRPHMIGDLSIFETKKSQNFLERNPPVLRSQIDKILNIHVVNGPGYEGEYDIYAEYNKTGMSSADYYLEDHINQFYRILFFFMELDARGLSTDEDDIYDGPIPKDRIP